MGYTIKTHDGQALTIKQEDGAVVAQLAKRLDLTPVELVSGEIIYLSKGTVARIEHTPDTEARTPKTIEAPDHRGKHSPAKERLREQLKKKNYPYNSKPVG